MIRCLILCAGKGTRLLPLTKEKPKPMIEIGGTPVVEIIYNHLMSQGVYEICINLHHLGDQIMKYMDMRGYFPCYSLEDRLLGTAGALKYMEQWLSDPFFAVNGDSISNVDYKEMLRVFNESKADMLVFSKHDDPCHNGGVYLMRKAILEHIPKGQVYSLHEDLIPAIRNNHFIDLYDFPDSFYFDIGTKVGLKKARAYFEKDRPS